MSGTGLPASLSLEANRRAAAVGQAAVCARLILEGFEFAFPVPGGGADLVALSRDLCRAVPIRVRVTSSTAIRLHRYWFQDPYSVLVVAWLRPERDRFFVLDAGAEPVLFGDEADLERLDITVEPATGLATSLLSFEDGFGTIAGRSGRAPDPGPADRVVPASHGAFRSTRHARERVDAGEVREEWIAEALVNPDCEAPDPRRPGVTLSWRRIAAFGNRALRVAHRPDDGQVCVITAFFDRGAAT